MFCIVFLFLVAEPRDEAPGALNEHENVQREQSVLLLGQNEDQPDELVKQARKPCVPFPADRQFNTDDSRETHDPIEVLKQPVQSCTAGAIMIWRSSGVAWSYSASAASHFVTVSRGWMCRLASVM